MAGVSSADRSLYSRDWGAAGKTIPATIRVKGFGLTRQGLRLDTKARLRYKKRSTQKQETVEHFVGGGVVAAGRNGITTGHR
jgi:hypothetical protein